jgi:hypothetical protein
VDIRRPGGPGKARDQNFFPGQRHVLALAPAIDLRLERLDPAAVVGHVGALQGAQRDTHCLRSRGMSRSCSRAATQFECGSHCAAGVFDRSAVFSFRICPLVNLTIRRPELDSRSKSYSSATKNNIENSAKSYGSVAV